MILKKMHNQYWLGHSKYEVTVNTYSHINKGFEQEAIKAMSQFWKKKDN
jgi:hypothetical protein